MVISGGRRKGKGSWEDFAQSMEALGEKRGVWALQRGDRVGPGTGCPFGLEERLLELLTVPRERGVKAKGSPLSA